ncbi:MAG: Gfo/Idh/MocA family oxidoreductase [Saprospiraceae bacterium]|nr:Gfo/Idh/MocA family oxidoreductase [Saprospiraceae bacterium]MBK7737268.1 Gfo/Idh/MocA family oxidoreductase [Saprospiraceae bacterium]MBK7914138.1 Gfo/Idh/MocA family oxidoreductase [Saprospiraceae bacterium]
MARLKIGLAGTGHLGKIHLKCILENPDLELKGFYDLSPETRQKIASEYGIKAFESYDELISNCDAIDIVSSTSSHFELAQDAIKQNKHCFIEKPVTSSLEEATFLKNLLKEHPVKIQIGHVERFNPSFAAIRPFIKEPKFIEAHRLSSFNPRGRDVSVVHDIMIHDLDLICLMAKSEVKDIKANGVSLVSPLPDICNARIEFENGLVCNVTASRISMKQMRKIRIFQEDAYISCDLLEKEAQVIRLLDEYQDNTLEIETHKGNKYISLVNPEIKTVNAIAEELKSFYKSIVTDDMPEVNLDEGIQALALVQAITKQIETKQ